MDIAVIGAGVGGMAVASLLANEGHNVTIYEKNSTAGGKMGEIQSSGFRFDTGPSLITMPEVLENLFEQCGSDIRDYLTLEPLQPLCRYFYPDGTWFDNYQDRKRSLEEIRRIAPEDTGAYSDFLNYSHSLFEKTSSAFLFNPLFDLIDFKNLDPSDFWDIDAFSTVSRRVDSYFQSPYLRRFFKRFSTYNGSSPFQAPATLNVIPHVEIDRGGYYVRGGIYRIAEALETMAESLGVNFLFDAEVVSIKTDSGRAEGLELAGGHSVACDTIVSNADAFATYRTLLPEHNVSLPRKKIISRTEPSCSGFVILLGVDRRYDILRHHNLFFSDDYEAEFQAIFREKIPAENPSIYIANTSFTDHGHAPDGGSNLFILVNAPYLSDSFDWDKHAGSYAETIKSELTRRGLYDLDNSIVFESIITPLDFHRNFHSYKGSIYGSSSNSRVSAFMRPGNKARSVDGLYLTGGSTHPGGGIPLVILSAMHAFTLIGRYEKA